MPQAVRYSGSVSKVNVYGKVTVCRYFGCGNLGGTADPRQRFVLIAGRMGCLFLLPFGENGVGNNKGVSSNVLYYGLRRA